MRLLMLVPSIIHAHLLLRNPVGLVVLAVSLIFVTKDVPAKNSGASVRIPLEPLGFQLPQAQFLLAGSTMMTVDFIDDKHLLLTYSAKRLLKRMPECPPSDQDHVIEAIVAELPGGRPVARTSWRVHDRGQYLWNLGHGRFLLRNRDSLTTIAPIVNHPRGDAFRERPLIETKRRIGGVLLSPDADLLILETLEPLKPAGLEEAGGARAANPSDADTQQAENPVQINFFTLTPKQADGIELTPGMATRSRLPGRIPANSAGFISTLDQGQQHWAFDFNTYDGKKIELSPFDSTCRPSPVLVSRSEFIAFGCHLSHTPQVIGGFNLRGEEMWEQNLTETYMSPTFSYAPAAGRFAFSRMITRTSLVTDDSISPELVVGQSIIVYQTNTGRQVLRIDATPVARAGQNFALSPDGLSLAVIRTDAIEIYMLPPLTGKEREAVQRAEASVPRMTVGAGAGSPSMPAVASPSGGSEITGATPPPPQAPTAADSRAAELAEDPGAPASQAPAATAPADEAPGDSQKNGQGATEGDEQTPRKPPTLYNAPEEHPKEHPDANTQRPQ